MIFFLSKLASLIAVPSNLAVVLVAAGSLAVAFSLRWAMITVAAGLVILIVGGVMPVADWLGRPLENRFPPFNESEAAIAGIVVLGGSEDTRLSAIRNQLILNDSGERLISFADLARRYPNAKLAFSGGSGRLDGAPSEADTVRQWSYVLGLPSERITYESTSRNTYENATNIAAVLHPQPGERWLLVTSAMHMPRAVGCFRRAGFDIIAYPVDYRTGNEPFPAPSFISDGLFALDRVAREWMSLIAYRVAGYTEAMLPAP